MKPNAIAAPLAFRALRPLRSDSLCSPGFADSFDLRSSPAVGACAWEEAPSLAALLAFPVLRPLRSDSLRSAGFPLSQGGVLHPPRRPRARPLLGPHPVGRGRRSGRPDAAHLAAFGARARHQKRELCPHRRLAPAIQRCLALRAHRPRRVKFLRVGVARLQDLRASSGTRMMAARHLRPARDCYRQPRHGSLQLCDHDAPSRRVRGRCRPGIPRRQLDRDVHGDRHGRGFHHGQSPHRSVGSEAPQGAPRPALPGPSRSTSLRKGRDSAYLLRAMSPRTSPSTSTRMPTTASPSGSRRCSRRMRRTLRRASTHRPGRSSSPSRTVRATN